MTLSIKHIIWNFISAWKKMETIGSIFGTVDHVHSIPSYKGEAVHCLQSCLRVASGRQLLVDRKGGGKKKSEERQKHLENMVIFWNSGPPSNCYWRVKVILLLLTRHRILCACTIHLRTLEIYHFNLARGQNKQILPHLEQLPGKVMQYPTKHCVFFSILWPHHSHRLDVFVVYLTKKRWRNTYRKPICIQFLSTFWMHLR